MKLLAGKITSNENLSYPLSGMSSPLVAIIELSVDPKQIPNNDSAKCRVKGHQSLLTQQRSNWYIDNQKRGKSL